MALKVSCPVIDRRGETIAQKLYHAVTAGAAQEIAAALKDFPIFANGEGIAADTCAIPADIYPVVINESYNTGQDMASFSESNAFISSTTYGSSCRQSQNC